MRVILFTILGLVIEMAFGAEVAKVLRCQNSATQAITYTAGECPVGSVAVKRPEQGGFVTSGEEAARGTVTVCRFDSRFDRFRYVQGSDCPSGSSRFSVYSNATLEEARQQFNSSTTLDQDLRARTGSQRQERRKRTTRSRTMDCSALRLERDKIQARLNDNKAGQDDLQRLREAQEAIARDGCRSW